MKSDLLGDQLLAWVAKLARSVFQCLVHVCISDDLSTVLESESKHLRVEAVKLGIGRHVDDGVSFE